MKIAISQHAIQHPETWAEYAATISARVSSAAVLGAQLLCFAEYGSLELTSLLPPAVGTGVPPKDVAMAQVRALQEWHEEFLELFQRLAHQYNICIVAPSFPFLSHDGWVNRCWVFSPHATRYTDKVHMTRFETEWLTITGRPELTLYRWHNLSFGICICYDVEFPIQVRALVEAGADLILTPSCTDTEAGYQRVFLSARARALENQVYVAQAPLRGTSNVCEIVDTNTGLAGIYGPVDRGFPDNGILAEASPVDDWLIHDLNVEQLHDTRQNGQVRNHQDWFTPFNSRVVAEPL